MILSLWLACAPQQEELEREFGDLQVSNSDAEQLEFLRACRDQSGGAHLVWQELSGDEESIRYARSLDGGETWDDPVLLSGAQPARAPTLSCRGDALHLAWERIQDSGYPRIELLRSEDRGESWSVPRLADLEAAEETSGRDPVLYSADSGVYLVWAQSQDAAYRIVLQTSTDGGMTWLSQPVAVSSAEAEESFAGEGQVVADGEGTVHVIWQDRREGDAGIWARSSSTHGWTFEPEQRLDAGWGETYQPELQLSGGSAAAVWAYQDGPSQNLSVSQLAPSRDDWASTAPPTGLDARQPAMALDEAGEVHLAWQEKVDDFYTIFYSDLTSAEPEILPTQPTGVAHAYYPQLHAEEGLLLISWQDRRSDRQEVGFNDLYYSWSEDGGESWAPELRVNGNAPGSSWSSDHWTRPMPSGAWLHVWLDGRFGSPQVFANLLFPGEEAVW